MWTRFPGFAPHCRECIREPEAETEAAHAIRLLRRRLRSDEEDWCEVGDHYVTSSMMWPDFADCQECVDEEKYLEYMLEACYSQEEIDAILKEVYDAAI